MKTDLYNSIIDSVLDNKYSVVDNFISKHLIEKLYEIALIRFEEGKFKQAGIGKDDLFQKEKAVRSDKIQWLDKSIAVEPVKEYFTIVEGFVEYLNRTCFTNINDYEFMFAIYKKGTFYKRHFDRFVNDDSRQFSIITYLNSDWKPGNGGELVLYLPDETKIIEPIAGRMVFFRASEIEHEVLEVKKERISITGWLKTTVITNDVTIHSDLV